MIPNFIFSVDGTYRNHVLNDLRPYTCTFLDCVSEMVTFQTREAWWDHGMRFHRRKDWRCHHCEYASATHLDLQDHLQTVHSLSEETSLVEKGTSMNVPSESNRKACPLCCVVITAAPVKFAKHVAKHMEEVALMALPPKVSHENDTDEGSGEEKHCNSDDTASLARLVGYKQASQNCTVIEVAKCPNAFEPTVAMPQDLANQVPGDGTTENIFSRLRKVESSKKAQTFSDKVHKLPLRPSKTDLWYRKSLMR